MAAVGSFTSTTTTPAVTGTNSSTAAGAKGVFGSQTGGGANTRYGVVGNANGTAGIGVQGTGAKFGVFSNGPLGVTGPANISGGATVGGLTLLKGPAIIKGQTSIDNNAIVGGNFTCPGCITDSDLASGGNVSFLPSHSDDPQHATETGMFAVAGGDSQSGLVATTITFSRPLRTALDSTHVHLAPAVLNTGDDNCSGVNTAAPGYLCLYDRSNSNGSGVNIAFDHAVTYDGTGAILYFVVSGQPPSFIDGEYAVTAP
jgi:hypothetical protein